MAILSSAAWRTWWPRLVFLGSAAVMSAGVAEVIPLPLLHPFSAYHFFDLRIYRAATGMVVTGRPLYTAHLGHGLGFTYPPFAVLAMLPLRWVDLYHDEITVTLANIVLVAVAAHAAVRLHRPSADRARAGWLAAAIALWAEPVISTIGYGQIDLLIAVLITVDLAYGGRSRAGGIGIGVAAGLKLTPLVFIPYLLFTRRGRMAGRALAAFAMSTAIAFLAQPRDAAKYWGGTVFDVSRVTGRHHLSGGGPVDQSLHGALVRLLPGVAHLSVVWLPACLVVGCLGLLLAAHAARHGGELLGFLLASITGLLISPVSWTHHWALVVPGMLALATTVQRPATRRLLTLFATELALASSAIWLAIDLDPMGKPLGALAQVFADPYVLFGFAVIAGVAASELRRALTVRGSHAERAFRPQPLRVIPELPVR